VNSWFKLIITLMVLSVNCSYANITFAQERGVSSITAATHTVTLVQLSVQVVEVRVSDIKKYGLEFGNSFVFTEKAIPAVFTLGDIARVTQLQATLNLLAQQGRAKVLANPTLVVMPNRSAEVRIGGEIPFIITQALGQSVVEWKPYGIVLEVSPVVDYEKGVVTTSIRTMLSSPDYGNAVRINGAVYPVLNTREARTVVQVHAGSTVVIAGLRHAVDTKQDSGVPLLGQLPLVGYLFKTRDARKEDTEVTIFVTPSLLKN